jgi:hypothetical protein
MTRTSILRPLLQQTLKPSQARFLATPATPKALYTPVLRPHDPAALHLKSGQTYEGQAFGAKKSIFGETVFSTSITSCEYGCVVLVAVREHVADDDRITLSLIAIGTIYPIDRHGIHDGSFLPRSDPRFHLAHDR